MTAMLTHPPASSWALGPDDQEPEHGSKEPLPTRYPGHPHTTGYTTPGGLPRIVIRTGHPLVSGRPLVRFTPQHGAHMGNCPQCHNATEGGAACGNCGLGPMVNRAAPPQRPVVSDEDDLNRDLEDPAPDWEL